MVLLSASICTKSGKALVARQFMEVSRSRIEGLLAAFPKLITTGEQHTFVETDSVRYVYQPMDSLYMVLITTKSSNILEDLETLRMFAKVIPDYCYTMTEHEVAKNSFALIFAFDEIVALGYRENVNIAQIRTFVEMDSHTENVHKMVQKNKEREARDFSKRKAKELSRLAKEKAMTGRAGGGGGGGSSGGYSGGFGSDTRGMGERASQSGFGSGGPMPSAAESKPAAAEPAPVKKPGRGMKLGGKPKTNEFVEALLAEGETVAAADAPITSSPAGSSTSIVTPQVHTESIHLKVDEKISLVANQEGGLESMEVKGILALTIADADKAKIKVTLDRTNCKKGAIFQTHPNVDKNVFNKTSVIGLKSSDRPFPLNTDLPVVKWRYQGTDESCIPLTINCWPNVNSDGSCDVNVDYELVEEGLELNDVVIRIPLPGGVGGPNVASVDGEYAYDSRHNILEWKLPVIDASSSNGSLEFSIKSKDTDDFFPVLVDFVSHQTFVGFNIAAVENIESGSAETYSSDIQFTVEKYEIA